jgi:hypothetical protein
MNPGNTHFATAPSWEAARQLVTFVPRVPRHTAGHALQSIQIHIRDHKDRELPIGARTLEAHYGAFVVSQTQPGAEEARRRALDVSYGQAARQGRVAGRAARTYELGPEPPPDDIDGRHPAVIAWHDRTMFYLIASDEMSAAELERIAQSMYEQGA